MQGLGRQAIDAVGGRAPPAPGGDHSVAEEVEVRLGVGVGVDGDAASRVDRCPYVHVTQIQPLGIRVDLQGGVVLGRGGDEGIDVG